ncbi:amino acid ABC transporter substrate-binding protein [Megamonas hypermegale]|uniref:Amino acid ABC transporter substrate-binding protein n=1 Tax=Megamonas hypermegale TaxID=158847 RepID=A0A921HNQ3_9FIRM|nr:amino acid ABC transporter substrate-binding protein [Megamonas hypermegale]MDM8144309.1 amino acid ABC transporter substrate-binding protein [Megamonas hypermegale]HJF85052.1 amino acid ABC transporter substrate-binding protein [Megamonas hypermegale]
MKKLWTLCLAMVFGAMMIAGCGGNEQSSSEGGADSSKPIVIGLDDSYPPMGFKDENNEIVGFDIDLAKEAAKRLNRPVEFKAIDWSSKEAELQSGRVDILWNGLDITEERKQNMLFSDPYMKNRQVVFVPVDVNVTSIDELKGKVIGTQSGSTAETFLDNNKEYADQFSEVKKYGDYIDAFMDLENGRIDAVVTDELVGTYYMQKHPNSFKETTIVVGEPTDFGIAFAKENTALRDEVQKVMNEMKADGTIAKISEKWFGKDITNE